MRAPSSLRTQLLRIVVILTPAAALYLALTRGVIGLSPDSLFYSSAGRTIVEEHRIAVPISYDAVNVGIGRRPFSRQDPQVEGRTGRALYPFTTWPPGYPMAIAGVMWVTGISATAAARTVVLLSSALTLLLAASLAGRLGRARSSIYVGALLGVLPFFQMTGRWAWSEPLFMALALSCLLFLSKWIEQPESRAFSLMTAGVLAAVASATRYIGLSLYILLVGSVILVLARRTHALKRLAFASVGGLLLYPVLVAPIWIRNLVVSGNLTGAPRLATPGGSIRRLFRTVLSLVESFVPAQHDVPGPSDFYQSFGLSAAVWTGATLAIVAVLLRTRRAVPDAIARTQTTGACHPVRALLVSFSAVYVLTVLVLAGVAGISASTRMMYPAAVCVAILLGHAVLIRIPQSHVNSGASTIIGVVALATLLSVSFVDHYGWGWPGYNTPHLLQRPVVSWVRSQATRGRLPNVVQTEPWLVAILHLTTGESFERLANLNDLAGEVSQRDGQDMLFLISEDPPASTYPCAAYRDKYVELLSAVSDSAVHGIGWSGWWIRGSSERGLDLRRRLTEIGTFDPCRT